MRIYSMVSAEIAGENKADTRLSAPTLSQLLLFGLPTLGSWLLQPILSLIDTSVVGMSASLFELAALGPGIAWCDSTAYLFNFVGVATTNLCATALAEGDTKGWRQSVSDAMAISVVMGLFLAALQVVLAPWIITLLCGAATESIPFALDYVRIRATAAPVAIPMIVTQAAFLANEDSITPLKAVVLGGFANLFGDLLLTTTLGMGLVGAAIATAFSQFVSFFYLVGVVYGRVRAQAREMTRAGTPTGTMERLSQLVQRPTRAGLKNFASFCGPLSFVLLVKSVLWSYTTLAASTKSVTSLAAHQITINFFLFFAIFGDTISQMVQTFIPGRYGSMAQPSEFTTIDDANISAAAVEAKATLSSSLENNAETPLLDDSGNSSGSSRSSSSSSSSSSSVGNIGSAPMLRPETAAMDVPALTSSSKYGSDADALDSSILSPAPDQLSSSSSLILKTPKSLISHLAGKLGFGRPSIAGPSADLTMGRITRLAVTFGVMNCVLATFLPELAGKFFTKSDEVVGAIAEIVSYVMMAVGLHAPMCALEGSLFATRDLTFVVVAYVLGGAGFLTYQTLVRQSALGTLGVWRGMAFYQLWRFCLFTWRVRSNTFKPLLKEGQQQPGK